MARRKWNIETIKQVVDGENPFIQVGYTAAAKKRKEGESWEDSKGKKWQRKGGHNIRLSSSDTPMIDAINSASKCSVCGMNVRVFGNKLDKKVFPKTQKCYDCLEGEEMIYRLTGKWESYEQLKLLKNKRSVLNNFRDKVLESLDFLKNETGKIRESLPNGEEIIFSGKSNPQWLKDAEEDLIKVDRELEIANKNIEEFELKLGK
jgi:hypothetical protein